MEKIGNLELEIWKIIQKYICPQLTAHLKIWCRRLNFFIWYYLMRGLRVWNIFLTSWMPMQTCNGTLNVHNYLCATAAIITVVEVQHQIFTTVWERLNFAYRMVNYVIRTELEYKNTAFIVSSTSDHDYSWEGYMM